MAGFWDNVGRVGFGLATGGLSELPGLVDRYVTHGSESANKAANAQRASLDAAMKRLQDFSAEQLQNRQNDLKATMAFYGPAERYLQSIYGGPATGPMPLAPGPGGGIPGGPPAHPPGFPKGAGPTPMNYGQGPRRGF